MQSALKCTANNVGWHNKAVQKSSASPKRPIILALTPPDIWLESSDRWGDPREKLLQGEEWQTQRIPVCRALGHPVDGRKGVQQLAIQLDETWKAVASRFEKNAELGYLP